MDLWIRSQDRTKLVKCNDIIIEPDSEDGENIRGYLIVGYFDKETEYEELGFYISKNRALEVLNAMQEHIGFLNVEMGAGRFGELDFQSDIVYEMPKE